MDSKKELELKKKQINSVLSYLMSHIEFTDIDQAEDSPEPVNTLLINPEQTLVYYECIYNNLQSKPIGRQRADGVWKELYAYFELYQLDEINEFIIESHLDEARRSIPSILKNIQNLNFSKINAQMNQEIASFVKSFRFYTYLFTHRDYIDNMRYIYYQVEDALNNIDYVESLYPSRRLLVESHPVYASSEFDSVYKTLIVWHQTMKDLMVKCDQLGNRISRV